MSNSVNLSLDVTKTGIQNPLIKVRQGDGGFETLHTTVTSNGEPLDLQGWTITFMGTTAGNHKIVDGNVKVVEAPNGIFDYTPSKAWGMDIGDFQMAYFKFVKGDGSASSANFRVSVIEAVDLTQDEAKNYISVVDATIADVRQRLTSSLASVTASVAATSSAASSMAVYVSSTASSAVSQVSSAASSASSVASSAAAKVSGVAAQVNSLSVGGRNYLLNSSGSSLNGWGNSGSVWSVISDDARGSVFTSKPTVAWTGGGTNSVYQALDKKLVGNQVTVSFWAKSSVNNANFHSEPQGGTAVFNPKLTTSWARYSYTIPSLSGTIYFMAVDAGTTYYLDDVKLELGNIATDWTPAPEDADSTFLKKAGDKMTGGLKGGQTNLPASGDLNTLTDTGKYCQTTSVNVANWANRPSNAPSLAFSVDVIGQADQSLVTQTYFVHTTSRMWVRTMWLDGTIKSSPWVELANDANVVHNTGTETIAGDKTFTGNDTFTGTLDAKQKIYTRTIGSTNDLQIIYTRVGNVVTGRYTVAKSGTFTLSNNDGYKCNAGYPVNVIAQNINAWFTTDNRFAAPDGASQGNFMFITSDPLPTA